LFNASEVINVIARHRQALSVAGLLAGFAASGSLTALAAQSRNAAPQTGPRIMVGTLRSTDKKLGTDMAEAIRSRISQDVPVKQLWVVPKADVNNALEGSGFSTTEALSPNDAKELARVLRADFYVEGTVTKTGNTVRVQPRLVLTRDNSLVQPLGTIEGGSNGAAASAVSKEVREAIKQLDAEKKCVDLFRQQKYAEAAAAARAGVAAYPKATIARACIANSYNAMYNAKQYPADSVISISKEILAIHPQNRTALGIVAPAYQAKGDTAASIDAYTALVSTDPGNTRIVEPVVSAIAASGQASRAVPIINQAVAENPGDPRLLDLQFRLLRAAKDWKGAIRAGEEMVKTDTALADTAYFLRLSDAYASDSQPQKAAETIARGVAKFPNNTDLRLYHVQLLRQGGQNQQAEQELRQLLAQNPKAPGAYVQLAQIQNDLNQYDQALASLHQARAAGDSGSLVGQAALLIGNNLYRATNTGSKKVDDYMMAARILSYADTNLTAPLQKAQAQFLAGVAQLSIGQQQLAIARDTKSCSAVQVARNAFTDAQINLPKGGSFNPDATKQALGALQQLAPYADQMGKALKCK
jgi:tetratricopeptide (TPR) repeat protein/TolB-like protein